MLPDQLIGTHMTIADKQDIAPDIKVKVKFQVKAHQTLYTAYWHFQNCGCYMCLSINLMHPVLSLWALHAWVDPTCMVTLGWQYQFQITGLHEDPPTTPQWSVQNNNRHTHAAHKTQCPPWLDGSYMHVPKPKEKYQSPGRYQILSKY